MTPQMLGLLGLYLGTAAICAVSAVVPVVNSEVFLLGAAGAALPAQIPALAACAAVGQMCGKAVLYLVGRGSLRGTALLRRYDARWGDRLARRGGTDALVLASAFSGVPPFYAVSVGAGALRWNFARFLAAGTVGRLARFSLLLALAHGVWETLR